MGIRDVRNLYTATFQVWHTPSGDEVISGVEAVWAKVVVGLGLADITVVVVIEVVVVLVVVLVIGAVQVV